MLGLVARPRPPSGCRGTALASRRPMACGGAERRNGAKPVGDDRLHEPVRQRHEGERGEREGDAVGQREGGDDLGEREPAQTVAGASAGKADGPSRAATTWLRPEDHSVSSYEPRSPPASFSPTDS